MKNSEIRFKVELDENNITEKIFWSATDAPTSGLMEAKAFNVGIWDHEKKETLSINLWNKEMTTLEMKYFFLDTLGGFAESLRNATDDHKMADDVQELCKKLADHVQKSSQQSK